MRISKKTRYGVRMMLELALHYGKGPVILKDIAREQDISEKFLSQIVLVLRSRGLVVSSRGAKGGHMLSRSPSEISMREIVEILEGDPGIVECVWNPSVCCRYPSCGAADLWQALENNISDFLDSITLADLVKKDEIKKSKNKSSQFSD